MSAAAATETAVPPPAAAPTKGKGGLLPMIIIAAVAAAMAGGGAWFLASKGHSSGASEHGSSSGHEEAKADEHGAHGDETAKGDAQYFTLQPAFVVNLEDTEAARYLQVEMELMARDSKALDAAKAHMPRIRNALLLLLGTRHVSDLSTRAGKEQLQKDVVAEVQKVMTEATGKPQIEAVYFNSFVMQ